MLRSAHRQKK